MAKGIVRLANSKPEERCKPFCEKLWGPRRKKGQWSYGIRLSAEDSTELRAFAKILKNKVFIIGWCKEEDTHGYKRAQDIAAERAFDLEKKIAQGKLVFDVSHKEQTQKQELSVPQSTRNQGSRRAPHKT